MKENHSVVRVQSIDSLKKLSFVDNSIIVLLYFPLISKNNTCYFPLLYFFSFHLLFLLIQVCIIILDFGCIFCFTIFFLPFKAKPNMMLPPNWLPLS